MAATKVEYAIPSIKKTGATEQTLLTKHSPGTRQAPSIRIHHAGYAAHYKLLYISVFLWLAANLLRMPLDHRGRSG
uniref:Uncharacterized protein n=1 Tax=Mesocestoides corti TaxID=53468 RepID=A0A5K3FZI0_MESCO